MKLEHSFQVDAPAEEVWQALVDIENIAPCLPGAQITEAQADGTYKGSFEVKLGPTTAAYRGTLKLQSMDEQARSVTMDANGQDRRGQGSAKATIVSSLSEQDGKTQVDLATDLTITGRLASFGRGGMINDVSNRLLRDFAQCLQAKMEGGSQGPSGQEQSAQQTQTSADGHGGAASGHVYQSEPIQGFSVLSSIAGERLRQAAAQIDRDQAVTYAGIAFGVWLGWRIVRRLFGRR